MQQSALQILAIANRILLASTNLDVDTRPTVTPEERHVDLTQQEESSAGSLSSSSPVRILIEEEAETSSSSRPSETSLIDLTKDEAASGGEDLKCVEAKEIITICSPRSTMRPGKRQRRSIDSQSKDKRPRMTVSMATSSSYEGGDNKSQESLSPGAANARAIDNLAAVIRCAICQETVKESKSHLASTSCGHLFCQKCIRKAVRLTKCCPTCRKKIKLKDIHRVYF
mmetsp:Transcript_2574/g.3565  ORF Transcript_2574/g.3565 Transcript_2574/m.3565 type:complete len:227 (+) Transcript_2574:138-818(+)